MSGHGTEEKSQKDQVVTASKPSKTNTDIGIFWLFRSENWLRTDAHTNTSKKKKN